MLAADGAEVEVVRVVHHHVNALRAGRGGIVFVGFCGRRVVLARAVVVAGALVDVGGHVHQVSGRGSQRGDPIRVGQGALRMRRRFHRVNVEMHGADMVGIAAQDTFQRGDDFVGAFGGRAVRVP